MTYSIAVAGKGGTGKTSFSAMALSAMLRKGCNPILAVDADPNSNFCDSIGVDITKTVSNILETTKGMRDIPAGVNKLQMVEMELQTCMAETDNFDCIVMGCPEGPECYCAANNLLRTFMKKLASEYPYVVIDNEAGMEHLSRKITQNIDVLYLISDFSLVGLRAAKRVRDLCRSLKLTIKEIKLVVNKVTGELPDQMLNEIKNFNLNLAGTVPLDSLVAEYELNNKPLLELPENSPAFKQVSNIVLSDNIKVC